MLCCCRKVTAGSATKMLEVSVICEPTEKMTSGNNLISVFGKILLNTLDTLESLCFVFLWTCSFEVCYELNVPCLANLFKNVLIT